MSNALERLRAAKVRADESVNDAEAMDAYINDRIKHGGWSDADAREYRDAVSSILHSCSNGAIQAAREFWKSTLSAGPVEEINERIRKGAQHAE